MDSNSNKFYQIEFNHKMKHYQSNFKKEKYSDTYLTLKNQGTPEFFEYYENNSPIIISNYTGILKNFNWNYQDFKSFNDKYFSEKINSKIILYEKTPLDNNSNNKQIYQEIDSLIVDSLNNLTNILRINVASPKFYCKVCDNNYLSEKSHFTEIQYEYKNFLERIVIEENPLSDFFYFKNFLPEKVYNFKPFELQPTPFYQILKSDLFKTFANNIFDNFLQIKQEHSNRNDFSIYNRVDLKSKNNNFNFQDNYNNNNLIEIDDPYNNIEMSLPIFQNGNNIIITESKLTVEILSNYSIPDENITNLALKLEKINLKKNYILENLHENKTVDILKGFLDTQMGEADSYFGGAINSKKKELKNRLSTGSLFPIFNFDKLSETDKIFVKEVFPNNSYPQYKVKEIKPEVPDNEISNCQICEAKFIFMIRGKHHCRVCGSIFCDKCLVWSRVPFLGYISRVRVCKICQVTIKTELIDVIMDDLVETIKNLSYSDSQKKIRKDKIKILIGVLRKFKNFTKWSFLGYELSNKNICGLAISCFKYGNLDIEEWFNLAILFCKKDSYKNAFKCLNQIKNIQFNNIDNSKKKELLFEKTENFKNMSKENFEIFGVLCILCFYLFLSIDENDEKVILNNLMQKAYKFELEKFFSLSKLLIYFIREHFLDINNPNKNKNESIIFEYAMQLLNQNKNDFFYLNFLIIINVSLDSWLDLFMNFLDLKKLNLIKADIVQKCIEYFYPNVNLNFLDNKKYKKILFYNLTKIENHKFNPDFWLESFILNPEINEKGDNMILILFLKLFCNDISLYDLASRYLVENKIDYSFLCYMMISISENNYNHFLTLGESFYFNNLLKEAMISLYLSGKNFIEFGDYFASKKLFDMSISCYFQLGFERAVDLIIKQLSDISYEDFLLCNFSVLKKNTNPKTKSILLTNLILALKDNNKLNPVDYGLLLFKSIKIFENCLENSYIANFHLLVCDIMIEENFQIAIGALHCVVNKNLDQFFKDKYDKVFENFNSKYSRIIYDKLSMGYINSEDLNYFINILKQLNSCRIEQAHKFYNDINSNKLVESKNLQQNNNIISDNRINNNKKYILMKLIKSYKEKYLNNYKNSLKHLFDILIEYPNDDIYNILAEVFKTENYFVLQSLNILKNNYHFIDEKIRKNNIGDNDLGRINLSDIPSYENFMDISFPNESKENKKEILSFIPEIFENEMNYFNYKLTAFEYLDLIRYLDNDLDRAQSILLSIVFLLKETNRILNLNYISAIKKVILELIFNVYYIAKNFSTGIIQLYYYKIIFIVILEIIKDSQITNYQKLQMILKDILKTINIGYKIFPFNYKHILSLENFSYLRSKKIKFLTNFLRGNTNEFSILENKFYSFENSRILNDSNNMMFNLYEFKNNLFLQNKIDLTEMEKFMNFGLLNRDNNGFLNMDQNKLNLSYDSFSNLHGFKIDIENSKIELLLEMNNEKVFTMQDIYEIFKNGFFEIALSLNNCNTDYPIETYYKLDFTPKNLRDTNTLYTIFHVDYLLKMFSIGIEVSSKFPFNSKCATEGYLHKLPIDFQRKFEEIISKTQKKMLFENKSPKVWLECSTNNYNFSVDPLTDEVKFFIFDPVFKISTDETLLLDELVLFLNQNFFQLINYFPILKRFKEIVKLISVLHLIENTQSEQFLINTNNSLIEKELNEIFKKLAVLPSKYVNKLVTLMKPKTVNQYNSITKRYELITKMEPVQEWQNVYDPTNYNKQLELNIKEVKNNLRFLVKTEIDDSKSIEKFCESFENRYDLVNTIISCIKKIRLGKINEALSSIKKRFNFNNGKIKDSFENEKIVNIPTGIFNRKNNTIIYGGIHIKPNLQLNNGLSKNNQEKNNSKYIVI